jgi:hypothetical protein
VGAAAAAAARTYLLSIKKREPAFIGDGGDGRAFFVLPVRRGNVKQVQVQVLYAMLCAAVCDNGSGGGGGYR